MSIHEKIQAYRGEMIGTVGEHHRYRSWEHCYRYFHDTPANVIAANRDQAALQLGFYLASWGMYRGSSFLLQYAYTVHRGVVDVFVNAKFRALKDEGFGTIYVDAMVPLILQAAEVLRDGYGSFSGLFDSRKASDTLVTKVLLGTFGCLPACDRYFINGWRSTGRSYSCLNSRFIERVLRFCRDNLAELREEQNQIARQEPDGVRYPLMKLVDMYFWQIGFERESAGNLPRERA